MKTEWNYFILTILVSAVVSYIGIRLLLQITRMFI